VFDNIQKEDEKSTLRLNLKKTRSSISQKNRLHAEKIVVDHAKKLELYNSSKKIGLYLNMPNELGTTSLLNDAKKTGKDVYCPVIDEQRKGLMSFKQYSNNLVKNRFGIQEPSATSDTLQAQELCLIFIPLLGFDLNGERLGMGGGYYDRLLNFKKTSPTNTKPWLIGLAFDAQYVDSLPTQPWDIRLDAVITESKTHIFNQAIRY